MTGSGEGWASPSAGWDSEDEEIVTEIREVWRMSAVSFTVAEDSCDSLDAEEVAQIKVHGMVEMAKWVVICGCEYGSM